jgi:hypothetical protein
MDLSWISWFVGPPIFAAIIGVVAGRYSQTRKRVTFIIGNSEDLTLPLRQQAHDVVTFKFAGEDWLNLNRASIIVNNTGNRSISDLRFDIVMPGQHNHYQAAVGQTSPEILQSVQIDWPRQPVNYCNPIFNISLPFFNRKESFTVYIYFEGTLDKCEVRCRMEGVDVQIRNARRGRPEGRSMIDRFRVSRISRR